VSVVGPETLSIVGEPDVDDVVFGAGKEEIALLIEFYLRQGPLVPCNEWVGSNDGMAIIKDTNLEGELASES